MSKRFTIPFIACLMLLFTSSCQKDDLCSRDTPATPRLIVVFRDQSNPLLAKTVNSLQVRELGNTDFAPLNAAGALILSATDSIAIPLKFENTGTVYEFIRTDGEGMENIDTITFSYELGEVYVNRACGFKGIYNNLVSTLTQEPGFSRWIQAVLPLQNDVTSNAAAHVEIRH